MLEVSDLVSDIDTVNGIRMRTVNNSHCHKINRVPSIFTVKRESIT